MMNDLSLLSIALILFLIMDPLGNVSSFLSLVDNINPKRVRLIVIREMLIALTLMIIFSFIGEYLIDLLGVTVTTVQISSALILFLTAIKIIFPSANSLRSNFPRGEPFIVPIAVPLIAGPSLLATIMLFTHLASSFSVILLGIFISWAFASSILLASSFFQRYLGKNGLIACEKLMGMILVMLAIQRLTEGVHQFYLEYQKRM